MCCDKSWHLKRLDLYWPAAVRSHNQNSWTAAQRGLRGWEISKTQITNIKMLTVLNKCQQHVIFSFIFLLPKKVRFVIHKHRCTCAQRHVKACTHVSNKPRSEPFEETYTTVNPLGPAFYDTPLSCVLTTRVVSVEGRELIDRNSGKIHCRSFTASLKWTHSVTSEICFQYLNRRLFPLVFWPFLFF